jgi:hypothetical protein
LRVKGCTVAQFGKVRRHDVDTTRKAVRVAMTKVEAT